MVDERVARAYALKEAGHNQTAIAKELGVNQGTVSRWFRSHPMQRTTPVRSPVARRPRRDPPAPVADPPPAVADTPPPKTPRCPRVAPAPAVPVAPPPPALLGPPPPHFVDMAQSRPAPWRERLDEAAHGWALLMSDAMVAGSIGAPPGEFGAFLLRGERDLESQRDTEAARWVQVRGEARAVPVRESAEVLLGMLRDPDGRNRLKAAQFIQERVGGLAPPAPVQVTVSQAVAVAPATGPGVVVSALNAAFQRRLEAEAQAQVVEVAG